MSIIALPAIVGVAEHASLWRSAYRAGLPAYDILNGHYPRQDATAEYPLALPYALFRWMTWAGSGEAGDIAALYELRKGLGRHAAQSHWTGAKLRIVAIADLFGEVLDFLPLFRSSDLNFIMNDIDDWLATFRRNSRCMPRAASRQEFIDYVQSHFPGTILAQRALGLLGPTS